VGIDDDHAVGAARNRPGHCTCGDGLAGLERTVLAGIPHIGQDGRYLRHAGFAEGVLQLERFDERVVCRRRRDEYRPFAGIDAAPVEVDADADLAVGKPDSLDIRERLAEIGCERCRERLGAAAANDHGPSQNARE